MLKDSTFGFVILLGLAFSLLICAIIIIHAERNKALENYCGNKYITTFFHSNIRYVLCLDEHQEFKVKKFE